MKEKNINELETFLYVPLLSPKNDPRLRKKVQKAVRNFHTHFEAFSVFY